MRVFIGLQEIANVVHNYASGFRSLGVETSTVVRDRAWQYPDSTYDVVLAEHLGPIPSAGGLTNRTRRLLWRLRFYLLFVKSAVTCDVFIFIFGSAFRSDRIDYWLLKKLGKRIVSVFLGSDTRYWFAYAQEAELLGTDADIRDYIKDGLKDQAHDFLAVKLETVQRAEAYSDLIVALPDAAQLQTRPYMRLNIPIDLSALVCEIPDREVPVVVHAPSKRSTKGTNQVLAAVEQLRSEGVNFEFRLIENAPNRQVREFLRQSDIVIDQVFSETVATLALEGLATGNVVLARYLPERVGIGCDCPVVNINAATLADKLREVIVNRPLRRQLAQTGRSYVEAHHSHVLVASQILKWLDPATRGAFQFNPTFFRDHFVMSGALAREEAQMLGNAPRYLGRADIRGLRFTEDQAAADAHPTETA